MAAYDDRLSDPMMNKVPEVTLIFWIIKIMATTVGETGADFLNFNLGFGLSSTTLLMTMFLLITLVSQIWTKGYVPWLYWVTVGHRSSAQRTVAR